MTTLEKAAQEAAEEIQRNWFYSIPDKMPTAKSSMEVITKHLAPVQAELDAKDAENKALRQIIADSVKALKSGVVAPDASLEFMREVPKEIGLVIDAKDKLLQEARVIVKAYSMFHKEGHGKRCKGCMAENWLSRLSKNE